MAKEGPRSRGKKRTPSEILFFCSAGHFSRFRISFRKPLPHNEVPSVLIRSFLIAVLVDSPKLCCVISKKKRKEKSGLGRNRPGETSEWSHLWQTNLRIMAIFLCVHTTSYFTCMNTHTYVIYEFIREWFINVLKKQTKEESQLSQHHHASLTNGDMSEECVVRTSQRVLTLPLGYTPTQPVTVPNPVGYCNTTACMQLNISKHRKGATKIPYKN